MKKCLVLLLALPAAVLQAQTGFTAVRPMIPGSPALNGIAQGPTGFVAVGDAGTIVWSADGSSWQAEVSGVTDNLASVAYGVGKYVAVGDNGRVLTSGDGKAWTPALQSVTGQRLNGVASNGNLFIAVGNGGASLQSSDGMSWTSLPSGTSQPLYGVAANAASWICVGAAGTGLYLNPLTGVREGWARFAPGTNADLTAVVATATWSENVPGVGADVPQYFYDAVGSDGRSYAINVQEPQTEVIVSSGAVYRASNLRVVVGGGLWQSDGGDIGFRGSQSTDLELLAFDASGNGFRTGYTTGVPSGWQQIDPLGNTIHGACSDPAGNAVYLVGGGGGIYRQIEIFGSRIANFSVLSQAGAGLPVDLGAVIEGPTPKNILFRAIGPALASFGVPAPLSKPELSVVSASGSLLGSNQGWSSQLAETMVQVQAFPLPQGSADAALLEPLPQGSVLATVTAPVGQQGVVLSEIYDADPAVDGTASISNASALVEVPAGGSVTVGFIIEGRAAQDFVFRAVGPALASLGVAHPLPDPVVAGLASHSTPSEVAVATQSAGAFALPSGGQDVALLGVGPGRFTATLSSASGAAGTVLVELYLAPSPTGAVNLN